VVVAAPMAQPDAEPVDEYEYVQPQDSHYVFSPPNVQIANTVSVAMRACHPTSRCSRTWLRALLLA